MNEKIPMIPCDPHKVAPQTWQCFMKSRSTAPLLVEIDQKSETPSWMGGELETRVLGKAKPTQLGRCLGLEPMARRSFLISTTIIHPQVPFVNPQTCAHSLQLSVKHELT